MVDAQWAIKQSDELVDGVIETNLIGPYTLSNEVARRLIKNNQPGRMVNIASMAAFNINPNSASVLYSTTKSAIVRMTESLAVEWAKNHINVNAIAPGIFHSEMADLMLERIGDVSKNLPRKRICTPEQMDSTLLFLVSPSSECVTGTCIKIDDGQSSR
jgi:NAD(P)-dependent dehydrogenase (short-subunit alcohol dehydrogenase family)